MTSRDELDELDMLRAIFMRQKELHEAYQQVGYRAEVKDIEEVRLLVLAMHSELDELLKEFPWKPWKQSYRLSSVAGVMAARRPQVIAEYADLLHFIIEFGVVAGITPDEAYQAYMAKSEVNVRRIQEGY